MESSKYLPTRGSNSNILLDSRKDIPIPTGDMARIIKRIEAMEGAGMKYLDGHKFKKIGNVYQLKIPGDKVTYRLLGFYENNTMHFVHVFKKKSQDTKLKDTKLAEIRRQRWIKEGL